MNLNYIIFFYLLNNICTFILKERSISINNSLERRHSSKSRKKNSKSKYNDYDSEDYYNDMGSNSLDNIPSSLPPIYLGGLTPQDVAKYTNGNLNANMGYQVQPQTDTTPPTQNPVSNPDSANSVSNPINPNPAYPTQGTTGSLGSKGALDYDLMLKKVNELRKENGVGPLKYNDKLNASAQQHSDDQAKMGKMSHKGSNGSTPSKRADNAGYEWTSVAENVAWNQKTVDEVMDAWKNSPGHFENLISSKYTDFGAGFNNYYWTQMFGNLN